MFQSVYLLKRQTIVARFRSNVKTVDNDAQSYTPAITPVEPRWRLSFATYQHSAGTHTLAAFHRVTAMRITLTSAGHMCFAKVDQLSLIHI